MTSARTRVHIFGASGSGTTTLGAALAAANGVAHFDVDDYYWELTDPPFVTPRPVDARLFSLEADLDRLQSWVLSGSLCGWGDALIPRFDLVVFLFARVEVRMGRLRKRELAEFGAAALAPGGDMHKNHRTFLEWAAAYDDGDLTMRSRARHDAWLARLPCEVMSLDGEEPVKTLLEQVRRKLS